MVRPAPRQQRDRVPPLCSRRTTQRLNQDRRSRQARSALISLGIPKLVRFHKIPINNSLVFYYLNGPPRASILPPTSMAVRQGEMLLRLGTQRTLFRFGTGLLPRNSYS